MHIFRLQVYETFLLLHIVLSLIFIIGCLYHVHLIPYDNCMPWLFTPSLCWPSIVWFVYCELCGGMCVGPERKDGSDSHSSLSSSSTSPDSGTVILCICSHNGMTSRRTQPRQGSYLSRHFSGTVRPNCSALLVKEGSWKSGFSRLMVDR